MRPEELRALLAQLAHGEISVDAAYRTLEGWPFSNPARLVWISSGKCAGGCPKSSIARGNGPSR